MQVNPIENMQGDSEELLSDTEHEDQNRAVRIMAVPIVIKT